MVVIYLGILPQKVLAQHRQIFGLHLTQDSDLSKSTSIINSHGSWGWATIVLEADDLNKDKWQRFFDEARRFHVQPIIRLATNFESGSWRRPSYQDLDNFASFLNSLNWPTENLPVIFFNEINHGNEWGGEVDLKNYADLALYGAKKFKDTNPKFILMAAPLDLAAPEKPPRFKSAENVYREIFLYNRHFFEYFDALASHSYANPNFSGKPTDTGKMSILGYRWELEYLKNLSVKSDYPVYITETGWPHIKLSKEQAMNNNLEALNSWLADDLVRAVTFFTFNYPYPPFEKFSWVTKEEQLYPEYEPILLVPKGANQPRQATKVEYVDHRLPLLVFEDTALEGEIDLKNTGQSIWGESHKCFDPLPNEYQQIPLCTEDLVEPGQTHTFTFTFRIPKSYKKDIVLSWQGINPIVLKHIEPDIGIYQNTPNLWQRLQRKLKSFF